MPEKTDTQLADRICAEQPGCDGCRFLQGGHCTVYDYAREVRNEQVYQRG